MATDQGAVLTIRAAARGIIDFRQADVRDVRWWRRANLLIRALADDDEVQGLMQALHYQLALVGNSGIRDEDFAEAQKRAQAILRDIIHLLQPWAAQKKGDNTVQSEIDRLTELYKSVFGDPSDPEVRARLDKMAEEFKRETERKRSERNRDKESSNRIEKAIAERDRRRAEALEQAAKAARR